MDSLKFLFCTQYFSINASQNIFLNTVEESLVRTLTFTPGNDEKYAKKLKIDKIQKYVMAYATN